MYNPYDPTQKGSDYYYDPIPPPPPPPDWKAGKSRKSQWALFYFIFMAIVLPIPIWMLHAGIIFTTIAASVGYLLACFIVFCCAVLRRRWQERLWLKFVLIIAIVIAVSLMLAEEDLYWMTYQKSANPAVDTNYTATDILADFGKDGCPCGYAVVYGMNVLNWSNGNYPVSIQSASSAFWQDPGQTEGSAQVGLWVYTNAADAQTAFAQVGNDETSPNTTWSEAMKPAEYLHGRCLLLITGYSSTTGPWSGYQQALDKYCV